MMTDDTEKPEFIRPKGRLSWPDKVYDAWHKESVRKGDIPAMLPNSEAIIPELIANPRVRLPTLFPGERIETTGEPLEDRVLTYYGTEQRNACRTGRWSGRSMVPQTFQTKLKVNEHVSAAVSLLAKEVMARQTDMIYAAITGREVPKRKPRTRENERIIRLLLSTDRRKRKRGMRLYGQYDSPKATAKRLARDYRERYPDLPKFWNTNRGEPYDPARYRKD